MHHWIDRSDQLAALLDNPPDAPCLDTEFMRTNTFFPKLALVQIALGDRIALIDTAADLDLAPLAAVLGDRERTCVMHSASEDLEALATVMPEGIGRLFDTQIAAAFAGLGPGLGYQRLVREITGIELPKTETRSDWLQRPLTALQLEYAAQDVMHLDVLREDLARRLQQRGYADWFAEDCARLVERARRRHPEPEPQTAFRGAATWPLDRQAVLRRIALWRDAAARALDRPRTWLIDDARILDLVARPPADGEELFARTRGLRALRGPQRAELLGLLQAPVDPAEREFAPIPPPSSPQQRRQLAGLKSVANDIAARLDLPDGLLCARRHLDILVATGAWPAALEGWRKPLLYDALMERIRT